MNIIIHKTRQFRKIVIQMTEKAVELTGGRIVCTMMANNTSPLRLCHPSRRAQRPFSNSLADYNISLSASLDFRVDWLLPVKGPIPQMPEMSLNS